MMMPMQAKERKDKDGKALRFFFRAGEWTDRLLLQGVDTDYIALPEHSWRLALTNTEVGINSRYTTCFKNIGIDMCLLTKTSPSAELGFYAAYRDFGFGYSWDLLNAYARNINFSIGSKSMGLEFMRQRSTNLSGRVKEMPTIRIHNGSLWITNTSLSVWYALNAKHYSHNAAIRQSFIQKHSAGSLMLHLAYKATNFKVPVTETSWWLPIFTNGVTRMTTHQVAVGLGYGINYTPNKGKVLFHLSAAAMLVCYSINQVGFVLADSIGEQLPGEPVYSIRPDHPVHVAGTMRAAISWEINKWVHLSAWAQANNMHFSSHQGELSALSINNWHWQAHLTLGVRFGAGKERVRKVLYGDQEPPVQPERPAGKSKLPKWIREYFYSPIF